MLILAAGLFRLDVMLRGDTMRIIVRNLSSGELEIESSVGDYEGGAVVVGDVSPYRPGRSSVAFALGHGDDRVTVERPDRHAAVLRARERADQRAGDRPRGAG